MVRFGAKKVETSPPFLFAGILFSKVGSSQLRRMAALIMTKNCIKLYTIFQGLRQITLQPIYKPFNKDVLLQNSLVVYLENHSISRLSSW